MAYVYKGKNHLRRSSWRNGLGSMLFITVSVVYLYLLGVGLIPFVSWYELWPLLFSAKAAQCFFYRYSRFNAGLYGEKLSLKYAKKLPSSYFVFTNVAFGQSGRRTEIDLVIVGKAGVFILEIKNHRGVIRGDAAAPEWTQFKTGRRGGKYMRPMHNPLWQARRQAYHLAQELRYRGIGVWVESAVVFVNHAVVVEVERKTMPILTSAKQICDFVLCNHCTQPLDEDRIERVKNVVRSLQRKG